MKRRGLIISLAAATFALAAGIGTSIWYLQPGQTAPGIAGSFLDTPVPDLDHKPFSLKQYQGKVLVVNFWATWCPPCRREIPHFIEAQRELAGKGVQFVGIAIDDPLAVAGFSKEMGFNYPILLGGDRESEAMRQLGDEGGGLPFTVIFDRNGAIQARKLGGIEAEELHRTLAPLL